MLQNIARSEFTGEKPVVDTENLVPSEKATPRRSSRPEQWTTSCLSPRIFLKSMASRGQPAHVLCRQRKQAACLHHRQRRGNGYALAHASLHQLKEGMKQAKLPFQYRIMMFERGHLSLPPESSPVWRELFVAQYVEHHKDDATE